MRWLLALLVLLPTLAFGQIPLEDISLLPVAPIFKCSECDPTDLNDLTVIKLLNESVLLNNKACVAANKNLFNEPASTRSCWRGAAFIIGSHNNIGYYVTNVSGTGRAIAVLLAYELRPGDITNCHQMIVCREAEKQIW